MARKRRTRRRRSAPVARRRRRRSSRAGFGGTTKSFVMDAVKGGIVGAAGFTAAETIPDRLGITQLQTGYGRIAGKALVGVVGGLVLSKAIGRKHGAAFAVGAMTAAGVSLYQQVRAGGLAGGGGLGMLAASTPPLLGQGDGADDVFDGVGDYVMDEPGVM